MAKIGETLTGTELIITILLIIFFPPGAICYVLGQCLCNVHVVVCTLLWFCLFYVGGTVYAAVAIYFLIEELPPPQNVDDRQNVA